MAQPVDYSPVFSASAADFLLALPRRSLRIIMDRAYALARHPFVEADFTLRDASGHTINHLLASDFLIAYWIDHAARLVMIIEIEDAG